MKSKKKRVWKIVSTVLTVLILLVIVWMVICRAMNKPMFIFGRAAVWIVSESMEDEIPRNSYILVESVTADEVKVGREDGDVIMFKSDDPTLKGGYNTHRIVGVNPDGTFVSRGDNNSKDDDYAVKRENVVGRYVRVLPVMSALMRFFLTPLGLAVTLVALLGMCLAIYLPDILKKSKPAPHSLTDEERERLIAEEVEKLKAGKDAQNAEETKETEETGKAEETQESGKEQ
ncbi:MAG: signal peptidase I [Clostridia bacterium]|nr:signal peptidase I [Clostridia bacterium]